MLSVQIVTFSLRYCNWMFKKSCLFFVTVLMVHIFSNFPQSTKKYRESLFQGWYLQMSHQKQKPMESQRRRQKMQTEHLPSRKFSIKLILNCAQYIQAFRLSWHAVGSLFGWYKMLYFQQSTFIGCFHLKYRLKFYLVIYAFQSFKSEFYIKVKDYQLLNCHVVYLKPSVRWTCAKDIWYKFSAHMGVLYGYFHIYGVSYTQMFQNISEELLKREKTVQEKCLSNDNFWVHFCVLITSIYFIFHLQMSQMCIMRAHIITET